MGLKKKLLVGSAVAAVGLLLAGAAVVYSTPALKWRAELLAMHARGDVFDLSSGELLRMLKPGSGYYLEPLLETGNPYMSIYNTRVSAADVAAGAEHFRANCSNCHGGEGAGGVGVALNTGTLERGDTDWGIYRNITRGIVGTSMTAQPVSDTEAWQIVAYIRSLAPGEAEPDTLFEVAAVSAERLLDGRDAPDDWLTYSGDYDGKRYSTLAEINAGNADRLTLEWMYQADSSDLYLETSPIVNAGVMYVTSSPGSVHALDAATGEEIWTYTRPVPRNLSLCCGTVNRGVAVLDETVYWGTIDAHLLAIDAVSGKPKWEVELAEHSTGYSITSAPLAVKDLVIIGVSGGEFGIRGHLDAYDAATGERRWRFYTIPGEGEPGNETWSGDSWKRGGAGAWLTGSYDPSTGLLYWGVGNPGPLYYGAVREGDNLYSCSVVALDVDTGTLEWHFQFTPHDLHDWAANQIPVLANLDWHGERRNLLLTANRNGFFYVLDRTDGEFLLARPFVEQNWAESIDESGRPVRRDEVIPTPEGVLTLPSPHGGTNWQSPAFSPDSGLFYVAAIDGGRIVYSEADTPVYEPGEYYLGSSHQLVSGDTPMVTSVKAIDPATGDVVWTYANPPRRTMWRTGGVLATAGGIVFGGDNSFLFALDATTGAELWRMNVGGIVNAAPVTYRVDGRQRIAVAAGRTILSFAVPDEPEAVIADRQ